MLITFTIRKPRQQQVGNTTAAFSYQMCNSKNIEIKNSYFIRNLEKNITYTKVIMIIVSSVTESLLTLMNNHKKL